MGRKHPDVDRTAFPLIYALDKFSFIIVAKEDPAVEGVVVEVLEPQATYPKSRWGKYKIPRVSDIVPNQKDMMEAGPSGRITPPPRPHTPMEECLSPSLSETNFWQGLDLSPIVSSEDLPQGSPIFSESTIEAMRVDLEENNWLELDSWPNEQ
jgi:hypothetical protein